MHNYSIALSASEKEHTNRITQQPCSFSPSLSAPILIFTYLFDCSVLSDFSFFSSSQFDPNCPPICFSLCAFFFFTRNKLSCLLTAAHQRSANKIASIQNAFFPRTNMLFFLLLSIRRRNSLNRCTTNNRCPFSPLHVMASISKKIHKIPPSPQIH